MRRLLIIVSLVLFPSLIFAEPLEFRGIKMGMKKEALNGITDTSTCSDYGDLGYCCSNDHVEIYNSYVTLYYCMKDESAEVDHIWMSFYSQYNYTNLRDALIEKYGKNYKIQRATVQNRMGAKFINNTAYWKLKNGVVSITEYGIDLEKGTIDLKDYSYFKRGKKKKEGKGF